MTHKLNITIDVEKLKIQPVLPEILQILELIRPEWKIKSIQVKVFTGGISNYLCGYYEEGGFHEDVVLFRIDGEGKDLMVDKDRERENMQVLHEAGCRPPLYALFNNGIAYGYIQGDTIDHVNVRDELVRKYKELIQPKAKLREELDQLWSHVEELNSPIVFCHNDLLLGNIIYNKEKGTVNFIDYEFAMYNYEHFEIGCHFCEYIGTDEIDITRYPDKPYQHNWLRYYLQCKAELNGDSADDVTAEM